jgi:hypothetical protein
MNFGSVGEKLLFVVVIIAFIMLFSLFRGRNPRKERAEIVRTLLAETRINTILVDTFDRQPKPRNFEVTGWQLHKKKLQFLGKTLQDDLGEAFGTAADYNRRLKAAKKAKSNERVTLELDPIKASLARIKAGLEDWLLSNVGGIDQQERPGMLDGLFGRW